MRVKIFNTVLIFFNSFDQFAKDESSKTVTKDYKKTSLREPMKIFEQFLSGLSDTWKGQRIEASDKDLTF